MNALEKLGYKKLPEYFGEFHKYQKYFEYDNTHYTINLYKNKATKELYKLGGVYGCSGIDVVTPFTFEEMRAILEMGEGDRNEIY